MGIEAYKDYFKKLLKSVDISIIYTTTKEIEIGASTFGAIIVNSEDIEKSNNSINFVNNNLKKIKRKEKFKRNINFQILIGDSNVNKIEERFTKILSEINEYIEDEKGNKSKITLSKAQWIDKDDTILKSKITLIIDISITESIYKDYNYKNIEWGGDGEYDKEI